MTVAPTAGKIDPALWVDQYGDALFRYALSRIRNVEVAEEVVQETFVSALQSKERFQSRSSVKTWLIGILKHKIIDHFRREAKESPLEDIEAWPEFLNRAFENGMWRMDSAPKAWTQNPREVIQNKEFQTIFKECLSKLPQKIGSAFSLREVEEMSTDQICKALTVSATHVWVMLHRARAQLRNCLERNWFSKS